MEIKYRNNTLWANVSEMVGTMAGTYDGIWSGYKVEFKLNGSQYTFETIEGIRGVAACKVKISENNEIVVTV